MNKIEIISLIGQKTGLPRRDVDIVITEAFNTISEALSAGDDVRIMGFGTFSTRSRAERVGKNPKTGEILNIPPKKTPAFKAGKHLIHAVNNNK